MRGTRNQEDVRPTSSISSPSDHRNTSSTLLPPSTLQRLPVIGVAHTTVHSAAGTSPLSCPPAVTSVPAYRPTHIATTTTTTTITPLSIQQLLPPSVRRPRLHRPTPTPARPSAMSPPAIDVASAKTAATRISRPAPRARRRA